MSTAQDVAEIVTSAHVQSVSVTPHNSVQAVTPRKPAPRVGPTTIIIPPGNFVASMEPEDLDTPPFTAQERLIYVPVDILNTRVGALLDSGCSDNFISRTTADQLGLTRYPLKSSIGMQMANGDKAYVDHFVRPVLRIGELLARLALKVLDTTIPMIIGYHFLRMLRVKPDWTTQKVELSHRGLTCEVQAATAPSGMINVIREFGSSFRELPFSRIPEEEDVPPTPTSPSVIEFFHSRKNHITEPFTVTLTNTFFTETVPPGKPTFLPRPPDTPLAAAVATVSPTHQEAELTPEERSEILRNLDQQQSGKKIGWMP